MCGILFQYSKNLDQESSVVEYNEEELFNGAKFEHPCSKVTTIIPYIVQRGPNYAALQTQGPFSWFSSVLSLRKPFTKQPIENDRYVLQYNGELYNDDISDNDTQYIMSLLESHTAIECIKAIKGEFAYTIWDKLERKLYFGRDSVGKRSLSYQVSDDGLTIASVTGASVGDFLNCDGGVIYIYDLATITTQRICDLYTVSSTESDEMDVSGLYNVLYEATKCRVDTIHPMHEGPISVLFSGGLDCTVIASLIAQVTTKQINLLNVGFENPRTGMQPHEAPDRILAVQSYKELKKLYPNFQLIEVDVPYDEYLLVKPKVIDLMYPKQTEMDLSIAIAFYFASRGVGFVHETREPYKNAGVVLFSGLGADELYGGYHKFNNKTPSELAKELTTQINNIHDRNLNRDDKVVASNGVEVRYPFLDTRVIAFSTQLPISVKTNKKILRQLASENKLVWISEEPKRAIQFGSKSAKMTKGNSHGTDLLS